MNTWGEFWAVVIPLLGAGIALGLWIARLLVDAGIMHA